MRTKLKVFRVDTQIQWKWFGRTISGSVIEIYFEPVSKTIKGKAIKRNGSDINPAYLVQSTAGNFALKLHSELQVFEREKSTVIRPRLFCAK